MRVRERMKVKFVFNRFACLMNRIACIRATIAWKQVLLICVYFWSCLQTSVRVHDWLNLSLVINWASARKAHDESQYFDQVHCARWQFFCFFPRFLVELFSCLWFKRSMRWIQIVNSNVSKINFRTCLK